MTLLENGDLLTSIEIMEAIEWKQRCKCNTAVKKKYNRAVFSLFIKPNLLQKGSAPQELGDFNKKIDME